MFTTIFSALVSVLETMPREDATAAFSALYLSTDAATVHTVGFVRDGIVYAVSLHNSDYARFLHWNTTSAKNGKDGEREPRLRVRIPKKEIFPDAFRVCAESEMLDKMAEMGKNRGEIFEEILTGKAKDESPYFSSVDSEVYGSIKISEATACTLSALAMALTVKTAQTLQMMLYTNHFPFAITNLLLDIITAKECNLSAPAQKIEIPETLAREMQNNYQILTNTIYFQYLAKNGFRSHGITSEKDWQTQKPRYFVEFRHIDYYARLDFS